jgi:hypothetical protein
MTIVPVPSTERAAFDLRLLGGASSRSVGYRGPVTVYTTGYTTISAAQRLYFDEQGISAARAQASCDTTTNINDISARLRVIEKLAWSQAGRSKGQAESIASAHAERRIAGQLQREVAGRVAEANQTYATRFRNRLLRRDGFPREFHPSTTDRTMMLSVTHANGRQLAAPTSPPDLGGSYDLAVVVHESAVVNFGETLLGGITLTDERLVELLKESKAEIPEELQITQDKDPWSITFTSERPVFAEFAGDKVKVAIRGRRFTRGDQVVRATMEISATYQLEKSGTGSRLTRQGDVVADYVNLEQQSVTQVAMKTFLRKKFEALFKPEIASDGLMLPEQLRAAGKLHLQQIKADQGWLNLAWNLPPRPDRVAAQQSAEGLR